MMKTMDLSVNLLLPLAIYRPKLTSAFGGKKNVYGFKLISVGSEMIKVQP
jgi:hypothetical protein